MKALFSQEFFDSVIDSLAEQRDAEWHVLNADMRLDRSRWEREREIADCLRSFSLVCKSWYSRSVRHVWSHLYIDSNWPASRIRALLDLLTTHPKLLLHIRRVDVHLFDAKVDSERPFLTLCSLLPLVPSFRIQSLNDQNPLYDWSQDRKISRAMDRFFCSSTLTTLFYQGKTFPLRILDFMPELHDLSLAGDIDGLLPLEGQRPQTRPFKDWAKRIEMRLICVRFIHAEAVLTAIVDSAPQIFSQLQEFHLARRTSPPASDYAHAEVNHAKIFSLAKNSLRRICLEAGKPLVCASYFLLVFLVHCA